MKKVDKLVKKHATRMAKEMDLQLKRGQIHVELMDSKALDEFLEGLH
ncbi:hypothetical protein ACJQWY_00490 [Weissella kandleri]